MDGTRRLFGILLLLQYFSSSSSALFFFLYNKFRIISSLAQSRLKRPSSVSVLNQCKSRMKLEVWLWVSSLWIEPASFFNLIFLIKTNLSLNEGSYLKIQIRKGDEAPVTYFDSLFLAISKSRFLARALVLNKSRWLTVSSLFPRGPFYWLFSAETNKVCCRGLLELFTFISSFFIVFRKGLWLTQWKPVCRKKRHPPFLVFWKHLSPQRVRPAWPSHLWPLNKTDRSLLCHSSRLLTPPPTYSKEKQLILFLFLKTGKLNEWALFWKR